MPREIRITLTTADNCTGTFAVREGEEKHAPAEWDRQPERRTVSASFELFEDGTLLETDDRDGDEWRELDACGDLRAILRRVNDGELLATAIDAELGAEESATEQSLTFWHERAQQLAAALRAAVETEQGNYKAPHDPANPSDPDTEPAWMHAARQLLGA